MKYTKEELEKLARQTNSCHEFLLSLGKSHSPGNFSYWKNKLISLNIDINHWQNLKGKKLNKNTEDILSFNNDLKFRISGTTLKTHLLKIGRSYRCEKCKIDSWNEEYLSLHIDHINGNWRDNRQENLRFLCPNCHSQTENYCGKKLKKKENICKCGKRMHKESKLCKNCYRMSIKKHKEKPRIDKKELLNLIWNIPSTEIAKIYNVSDRTIGNWCKYYSISKPDRGYWTGK